MSCFIHYTPYHLRESDWDAEKENLGDTVQRTLESFFPGFGDLVLRDGVIWDIPIFGIFSPVFNAISPGFFATEANEALIASPAT